MITEQQKSERRAYVGASEIGAIMGVSPWASAWDVWAAKTGRLDETPDNERMSLGRKLEPVVVDFLRDDMQTEIDTTPEHLHFVAGPIVAHPDGIVTKTGEPCEVKTAGILTRFSVIADEWGEPLTDQIPDGYQLQAQAQCLATQKPVCHVGALIGGRGFVRYLVEYDAEIGEMIAEAALKFMEAVKSDTPPDSSPSPSVLKRIIRQPAKIAPVTRELIEAYQQACEQEKASQKAKEAAQFALVGALGDAEAGEVDGKLAFTYYKQTRESVSTAEIKADAPDLYEGWKRITEYRVLRLKKI